MYKTQKDWVESVAWKNGFTLTEAQMHVQKAIADGLYHVFVGKKDERDEQSGTDL